MQKKKTSRCGWVFYWDERALACNGKDGSMRDPVKTC